MVYRRRHECNAYCKDGIHAGMWWSSQFGDIPRRATQYATELGVQLIDVTEAPEAPPVSPNGVGPYRYLLRWRRSS